MTREEWLNLALIEVRNLLLAHDADVPHDCRVSIGFPGGGSARKRIGECWPRARSKDGVNEIFISPVLDKPTKLLDVLVHEAIHASDDCASGHKGHFRKVAKSVGFEGKMTSTVPGAALALWIEKTIARLPAITHGALDLSGRKKQPTRLLKIECPGCGCILRGTAKALEVGLPTCGCGTTMEVVS
jgi:hypothetical protein